MPRRTIIGQLGLLLIVLEGGLYIELSTLRAVGWKAFAIAISGTSLPVLACILILPLLPPFSMLEAVAAGTALSSTAIGMAAKLMQDMGLLKTKIGQTICCAAMIDDVASLILLAMISSIATGESSGSAEAAVPDVVWGPTDGLWSVLTPLITSLSFIGLSTCFATVVPHAAGSVLGRVPAGSSAEGAACLSMLAAWATMLTLGAHYSRTTFLLGCFMGGVSFVSAPHTHLPVTSSLLIARNSCVLLGAAHRASPLFA